MNPTEQKLALEVEHYLNLARGNYFTVWAMYFVVRRERSGNGVCRDWLS